MVEIVTVTAKNIDKTGFFCAANARGTPGWEAKRRWLEDRFADGLQMRLLGEGERGFIEFMPGARSWRAIDDADTFVVIHCLWVVGTSRGHGFAAELVDHAETWARDHGYRGVAALTGSGNWLISPGVLDHLGYTTVDRAEHGFELLVKCFSGGCMPHLTGGWHAKAEACGDGLTVLRSAQCPYLAEGAAEARRAADRLGIPFHETLIESAEELRQLSPSPYGTFALVHDGTLLSYHVLRETQIVARLGKDRD